MKLNGMAIITFIALSATIFFFGYGAQSYWIRSAPVRVILLALCAILFLFAAAKIALTQGVTVPTKEDEEKLKRTGKLVLTRFKAIDRRWNIKVNGQSPIVIYAQGTDPSSKQASNCEHLKAKISGSPAVMHRNIKIRRLRRGNCCKMRT